MRRLWILRINAASRMYGMPYSIFMNALLRSNIKLDRKVLANLAVNEPLSFRAIAEVAQKFMKPTVSKAKNNV